MEDRRERGSTGSARWGSERSVEEQLQQGFSATVLELAENPENMERLPTPDVRGLVHGWCGDTMEIFLELQGDEIERATFATDGCGATLACGSALTLLVKGMSLEEAGKIRPEQVVAYLGGLPEESQHCAVLAVSTLQNALFNWRGLAEIQDRKIGLVAGNGKKEEVAVRAGELLRQGYH